MFSGAYNIAMRDTSRLIQELPLPPTTQYAWEIGHLHELFREHQPKNVLEIGCDSGGTLYHWLKMSMPETRVVAVDFPGGPFCSQGSGKWIPQWKKWAPEGVTLEIFLGDSESNSIRRKVQEHFPDGIDFLFIDGDHTYEGVRQDFLIYGPMVKARGIIAFHDILPIDKSKFPAGFWPEGYPECGVYRLWQEIQEAGYVTRTLVANPDQGWMGIGVVFV